MSVRSINKQKRRDRILAEARKVIAESGYDALNTRALAKSAEVTVPTLYNLIGSKEDIVRSLLMETIDRVEERLSDFEDAPPLQMTEAIILQSAALFAEDESYYQAAAIASDRASSEGDRSRWRLLTKRAEDMAERACAAAIEQKLLRGSISAHDLARQLFICYSTPMRDWTHGGIDLEEFKRRVLHGFYICLAADASDEFRSLLLDKIQELNAGEQQPSLRRA
jgi:AcrR family transcriptional regulator